MTSPVSHISARPRRLTMALLAAVSTLAFGSLAGTAAGCKGGGTTDTSQPGEQTIGDFCDEILPPFCTYAVQTCKQPGTVDSCIAASKSVCCQGACNRAASLVEGMSVGQCIRDYTGMDGNIADAGATDAASDADATDAASAQEGDAGAEAGAESDSGAPGLGTTQDGISPGKGISCDLVAAGFAPESCQNLAELLSASLLTGELHSY